MWSLRYSPGRGNWCCWVVALSVREGSKRDQCQLLGSQLAFSHFPLLPTSKLGPSGADSLVCGCVYLLGSSGSLQWALLWCWEFLLLLHFPQIFTARGFKALFPHAGTLGCTVCLTLQLFHPVYLHTNVGPPGPPATASPSWSSNHCLAAWLCFLSTLAACLLSSYWSEWMFLL